MFFRRVSGTSLDAITLPSFFGKAEASLEEISTATTTNEAFVASCLAPSLEILKKHFSQKLKATTRKKKVIEQRVLKIKGRLPKVNYKRRDLEKKLSTNRKLSGSLRALEIALEKLLEFDFSKTSYSQLEMLDFADGLLFVADRQRGVLLSRLHPELKQRMKRTKNQRSIQKSHNLRDREIRARYSKLREQGMSKNQTIKQLEDEGTARQWPKRSRLYEILPKKK